MKHLSFNTANLTMHHESGVGTMLDGQFNWGGFLLKSNAGAQRFPYLGWKSRCKRKGIWELYCKTHKSSSYESRS